MKNKLLFMVAVLIAIGCNRQSDSESLPRVERQVHSVTFTSHLSGDIASDPTVSLGQQILVVPDPAEPTENHESIVVRLPEETPYDGADEQYFLRGFAVGRLSARNIQFS